MLSLLGKRAGAARIYDRARFGSNLIVTLSSIAFGFREPTSIVTF